MTRFRGVIEFVLFVASIFKMRFDHFLFDCPKYSSIRDDFFNKIHNRIPNHKHIPVSTLIIQLMNSTDYYLNKQLVQYVTVLFTNARQFIIESLILLFDLLFVIAFVKMLLQCCKSLLWPCK